MLPALAPSPDHPPPNHVDLRILGRADIPRLVEHLLSLDAKGRRDRFNGAVSLETIEDYARRCIQPGVLVIAARAGGQAIAVAELHPIKPDTAEVAISVDAEWRGRGVGAALFALILEAAWSRGLSEIEITTHSANEAMKRLAGKFGATVRFVDGDSVGRIRLDDIRAVETTAAQAV